MRVTRLCSELISCTHGINSERNQRVHVKIVKNKDTKIFCKSLYTKRKFCDHQTKTIVHET